METETHTCPRPRPAVSASWGNRRAGEISLVARGALLSITQRMHAIDAAKAVGEVRIVL